MVYMWTYDFNTRGYKQIQLWFNVDCIADNDVVFCPTEDINKLSETESKGDDDMLVLPIKKNGTT